MLQRLSFAAISTLHADAILPECKVFLGLARLINALVVINLYRIQALGSSTIDSMRDKKNFIATVASGRC